MTSYRYEIKEKDKNVFPFDENSFEVNALAFKINRVIECARIQLIQHVLSCSVVSDSLRMDSLEPPGKPL